MTDSEASPTDQQRVEELMAQMPDGMGALNEKMGIRLVQMSPERVVGTMPVEGNTQPYGILHGAASVVLAESLGSMGSAVHALQGRRVCTARITCSLLPRDRFTR